MDFSLYVYWHIHSDQPLVCQEVGALAPEPQRRVDLFQQRKHVHVVDLAFAQRVVLAPHADELAQVVRTKNGRVPVRDQR